FSLTYCLLTGYFHNPHLVRLIQFSKVLTSPSGDNYYILSNYTSPVNYFVKKKLKKIEMRYFTALFDRS
ncbi:hypothetical protein, partial [Streptococcus sp. sy004]|uniref:hypothetical protein n=1 Tax=Streptococcus sp. sy004 TaxID=2600149 RepID=UPI001C9499CA